MGKTETQARAFADGRYAVEGTLGRGGMAAVFLARDRELERLVAVKVLDGRLAERADAGDRFRREALMVARLSHPNVVAVYDAGEDDGRPFIVMEYVDGDGLDAILAREGPLPPDRAVQLALQACAGLGYAHAQGIVHRDVKPANLLVRSSDGVLKVSDFGLARASDSTTNLTQAGTVLGTMSYLAPEQASGEPAGPRADVFSLGVVLYEALTGSPPWRVESVAQLAGVAATAPRPIREVAPGVPPEVESAVLRSLAREPAARPADAGALARELAPGDEPPTVLIERPAPRPGRGRPGLRPALVGAAVLAAAIAALAAGISRIDDDGAPAPKQQSRPARVQPVPAAGDAAGQARNLERWLRSHTRSPG